MPVITTIANTTATIIDGFLKVPRKLAHKLIEAQENIRRPRPQKKKRWEKQKLARKHETLLKNKEELIDQRPSLRTTLKKLNFKKAEIAANRPRYIAVFVVLSVLLFMAIFAGELAWTVGPLADLLGFDLSVGLSSIELPSLMYLLGATIIMLSVLIFSGHLAASTSSKQKQFLGWLSLALVGISLGLIRIENHQLSELGFAGGIGIALATVVFPVLAAFFIGVLGQKLSDLLADYRAWYCQWTNIKGHGRVIKKELRQNLLIGLWYDFRLSAIGKQRDRIEGEERLHNHKLEKHAARTQTRKASYNLWYARIQQLHLLRKQRKGIEQQRTRKGRALATTSIVLFILLLLLGGCDDQAPVAQVVLVDASSSSLATKTNIGNTVKEFLTSNHRGGSVLYVMTTGCGISDVSTIFDVQVPDSWGPGVRWRKQEWAEENFQRFESGFKPETRRKCSAIFAALWRAAQLLKEYPTHERSIILASDLREVSKELGNFELRILSSEECKRRLKKASLFSDLHGISVTVVGFHYQSPKGSSKWTAAKATKLLHLWLDLLTEMGAGNVSIHEIKGI